jgi:hypothetical protein
MGRGSRVRPAHLVHLGQRVTRDRRVTRVFLDRRVTRDLRVFLDRRVTRDLRVFLDRREYLEPMAPLSTTEVHGTCKLGIIHTMW